MPLTSARPDPTTRGHAELAPVLARCADSSRVRGYGAIVCLAFALACLPACVFYPPPPLPEELAAEEAARSARVASLRGGTPAGTETGEEAEGSAGEEPAMTFKPGDPAPAGMSPTQLLAYRQSQGDPITGEFTLEQALMADG